MQMVADRDLPAALDHRVSDSRVNSAQCLHAEVKSKYFSSADHNTV